MEDNHSSTFSQRADMETPHNHGKRQAFFFFATMEESCPCLNSIYCILFAFINLISLLSLQIGIGNKLGFLMCTDRNKPCTH